MNETLMQVIIFIMLVFQGASTRFSYLPTIYLQKRVNSKAFTFVTDIMTALIGAAGMLLTCFLFAGEVRIFYALFFLGGIVLAHLILKKFKDFQFKNLSIVVKAGNMLKSLSNKFKRKPKKAQATK